MLEKEFIPYQESLVLKELGFDEPCISGYSTTTKQRYFYSRPTSTQDSFTVDNPTYSQAFRFFREKYDLRSWIESFNKTNYKAVILNHYGSTFNSHEEAELACLKKLIEIAKSQPA